MEKCIACGSTLQTSEYQSRSADEAHTVVTSCASCPVNASKLTANIMPNTSFRGIGRPILRPKHMRVVSGGTRDGDMQVLRTDLHPGHKYNSIDLDIPHVTTADEVTVASNDGTPIRAIATYSISGFLPLMSVLLKSSVCVGAGVHIDTYDTFVHRVVHSPIIQTCHGLLAVVEPVLGHRSYVYMSNNKKKRELIIVLGGCNSSGFSLPDIVEHLYCENMVPSQLLQYMSRDDISRLSNLSARGWDATSPPNGGHVFTSKPDGERCWLTKYGNMWYATGRWYKGNTKHWQYDRRQSATVEAPVVLDVEYIQRHGYILIDVLCDGKNFAPVSRDIRWVIDMYREMKLYESAPQVILRDYFVNYESARLYSDIALYPTDGVVAIRNGSTEILKIKHTKSMELQHVSGGMLYTSEGTHVCNIFPYSTIDDSSIVEVRFTADQHNMKLNIESVFERSDKSVANSAIAVQNILASAVKPKTPGDNERRAAYLWCNSLRDMIREKSQAVNKERSIVLDVGSGNGQAFDSSISSDYVSCVYVEPDTHACAALARRLNIKHIVIDPMDIMPLIRSLKMRSLRGVVMNCSLETLCSSTNVMKILAPELKCVLCTFSMHFVIDALHMISDYDKVPIYGCGYLYDDVDKDGVLIDESGVIMKTNSDTTATVRWGGDAEYTEPATTRRHYAGLGRTVSGLALVPFENTSNLVSALAICKRVYVLVPY